MLLTQRLTNKSYDSLVMQFVALLTSKKIGNGFRYLASTLQSYNKDSQERIKSFLPSSRIGTLSSHIRCESIQYIYSPMGVLLQSYSSADGWGMSPGKPYKRSSVYIKK